MPRSLAHSATTRPSALRTETSSREGTANAAGRGMGTPVASERRPRTGKVGPIRPAPGAAVRSAPGLVERLQVQALPEDGPAQLAVHDLQIAGRERKGSLGGQRGPAGLAPWLLAPCAWLRLRATPKRVRHASAHGLRRLKVLQPPEPGALIAHDSMWRRGHRAHVDGAIDQMPPPFEVQPTKLQLERAQLDVRVICARDTHTRRQGCE